MRTRRLIMTASVAAAVVAPAGFANATTHAQSHLVDGVRVPVAAGKLVQGPIHYLRPRGYVSPDQVGVKTTRASAASGSPGNNLVYGGGPSTSTVSTAPAVYIVFWGSQWSKTDAYAT